MTIKHKKNHFVLVHFMVNANSHMTDVIERYKMIFHRKNGSFHKRYFVKTAIF